MTLSNITAATQFLRVGEQQYAYRCFGDRRGPPLLLLQHFTGTLDNWDRAVTDPLAQSREAILFENAVWDDPRDRYPERWRGWRSTCWHSWTQ